MLLSSQNSPCPGGQATEIDPHGQAALLLTESLIHQLLACDNLSRSDAAEVMRGAIEAQIEIDLDRGIEPAATSQSLGLLERIQATLSIDAQGS